ncbi:NAD(P)-binding domain-containing protein [Arthrobacter sp. EH-1B-1]|uniref:NAD(P)-binding domain-containing protein n=1 Tax=Arthrobacter vasquezii TaxID=2977629 RepID=A0ABT6CU93_9MICC|nr:NAD(P)-binding domain-containing protein [Arthrobacter vasquezii]MDF9277598.1 NAD(P)-binding domain-containing protein [Arthrobacter vasquezii]
MNITIIGLGQVGLCWAEALSATHTVSVSDPHPPAIARTWSESTGIPIRPEVSEWIGGQDLVLMCVPGSVLPLLSGPLACHVSAGATVVDMTTAAAQAKREAAALIEASNVGYLDVAITGAVALSGVRTPLLCAGKRNTSVEEMFLNVGAPFRLLPDSTPGDAVTVKLLRSVIMKGLEALAIEALPAARSYGVLDHLYAVLQDVDQAPFTSLLESMVATHPDHAVRRRAEVIEAAGQLSRAGYPAALTEHVAEKFSTTVDTVSRLGAPTSSTFEASMAWLEITAKGATDQAEAEDTSGPSLRLTQHS